MDKTECGVSDHPNARMLVITAVKSRFGTVFVTFYAEIEMFQY